MDLFFDVDMSKYDEISENENQLMLKMVKITPMMIYLQINNSFDSDDD